MKHFKVANLHSLGEVQRMEYIRDIHERAEKLGHPVISIEFFPPKTARGEAVLLDKTIPNLMTLHPDYCSVTYGAGGSTREKTLRIVKTIQDKHGLPAMSHLTCVGANEAALRAYLEMAKAANVKNILALRGDPPAGTAFEKTAGGFEFSFQLVKLIASYESFSIGVAGFPEGHIACKAGKHVDWQHLKSKAEAGADFVLTQLFFDNRDYFEFRDFVRHKVGVDLPICPGILPILSGAQIKRFTELCGASIPKIMSDKLAQFGDDDDSVVKFGIDFASQQCRALLDERAPGLHFYCLNKSHSTMRVIENLGLKPPSKIDSKIDSKPSSKS